MALDEQVFQVIDLQGNIETPMDSGEHLEITKSVDGVQGVVSSNPTVPTKRQKAWQNDFCQAFGVCADVKKASRSLLAF